MQKEMKFQKETKFVENYVTKHIIKCVDFYNKDLGGKFVHENNISGKWGSREQNKLAKETDREDFLLGCVLEDCKVFCNSDGARKIGSTFESGRTRSHVWVHIDGERVLMIHF
jgi:hypothetical protein